MYPGGDEESSLSADDDGERFDNVALTDGVDDFLAVADHFTKNSVFAVEVRGGDMGDEELRAVGVRASICHAENAGAVVLELKRGEFVIPFVAGVAASTAMRVAALDHEVGDHPMESQSIIKAILGKEDKVIDGDRCFGGEKLDAKVAFVGRKLGDIALLGVDLHGWRIVILFHSINLPVQFCPNGSKKHKFLQLFTR